MSDDSLIDNTERDKRKKMALIVGGTLAALQVLFLFTFRSYLDFGHILTTIPYMLAVVMAFWALRAAKIIPAVLCIVVAAGLLWVSLGKVKWNERYLQGLATTNAFILEDYIDEYPTLEEHMLAKTLRKKDWVRFAENCVTPAMRQQPVAGFCRDATLIQQHYRINVPAEIDIFMRRMQKTAQDIESGRIRTGSQYQQCIAEKRCAPIPLLPEDVDAEKLVNDSTQHIEIRKAFWDLVEGRGLTPGICNAMTLCRSMLATGVVSFGRPGAANAGQ